MFSLGELFVKLGFDVDDKKLKEFNEGLKNSLEGVLKLGAAATATAGILATFVQNAADSAVKLNNMVSLWGVNAQGAQTFANALHMVNSAISVPEGQEKIRAFTELINASISQGKGGEAAGALARLGVNWNENINTDSALKDIFANYKTVLRGLNPDPEKARAIYSQLLGAVNLSGTQNLIAGGWDKEQAASKYNIPDDWNAKLGEYAKQTAEMTEAWHKFTTLIAVDMLPPLEAGVKAIINALNFLEQFNEGHPAIAAAEGVGAAGATALGGWALFRKLFGGGGAAAGADVTAGAAGGMGLARTLGIGGLLTYFLYNGPVGDAIHSGFDKEEEGAKWLAGKIKGKAAPGAQGYFENMGFTKEQAAGIVQRLNVESGLNPNIYGHDKEAKGMPGEAYGIAQWHPDRQRLFKDVFGKDIHGSSLEEQLAFVNYELLHGSILERGANDKIRQAKTQQEAYNYFTNGYERPAGSVTQTYNLTVNVPSGDPHEIGKACAAHIQSMNNRTLAQSPGGGTL